MSVEFENYTEASKNYDSGRVPLGAEETLQLAQNHFGPDIASISILEAGCGTGNFLQFFQPQVGDLTGIDINEGMLGRAKEKLAECQNVRLLQGSLLEKLPFPDASFHLVMINQVLHHLVPENDFENLQSLVEEFHRVLKSNGLLVINHCLPEQVNGWWYQVIIPAAFQRSTARAIKREDLDKFLTAAGFQNIQVQPLSDLFWSKEVSEDLDGPSKKWWRDLDSTWALAMEQELQSGLENFAALSQKQKRHLYEEKAKRRQELGFVSIISAIKTH